MTTAGLVFAALAGLIHVAIFFMESIFFMKPQVHRGVFRMKAEDAPVLENLMFNQGFYNLFVAVGLFGGIALGRMGYPTEGSTLVLYTCGFMVAAAFVLLCTDRRMIRGVILQGLPPLVALALMLGA